MGGAGHETIRGSGIARNLQLQINLADKHQPLGKLKLLQAKHMRVTRVMH
jgi:hypothetical protein